MRQLVLRLTPPAKTRKPRTRRPPRRPAAGAFASALDGEHLATLAGLLAAAELDALLARGEVQLAGVAAALRAACAGPNLPAAGREAHKLAGLAGSLGCPAVAEAARQIEAAAGAHPARARALVADLEGLVPTAIEALRAWRTKTLAQPAHG